MMIEKVRRYGVDDSTDAAGLKAAMARYADEVDAKMAKDIVTCPGASLFIVATLRTRAGML
jgi:hypothetical protein